MNINNVSMNEFKTKNVIMKTEIYETPKCEVIILENEGAILEGSLTTGSTPRGGPTASEEWRDESVM